MPIESVKSRIAAIPADDVAAATARLGDEVRGWWACVANTGAVHIESESTMHTVADGVQRADALVDQGVGAVIVHLRSAIDDTSRAIVGLLCGADATAMTPQSGDDVTWMRACATLRDLQARYREHRADALDHVGDDVAGLVGLLLGLAARRTPAVLVGTAAHAAAAVAQRQSSAAVDWWRSGCASSDPLVDVVCRRLQFTSWLHVRTPIRPDVMDDAVAGIIASMRD